MQVVADDPPLLPQPTRYAGAEMASEEVQSLPALPEVRHLRLIRVQPQPQRAEDLLHGVQRRPGLRRAAAQHHAVIGVAHQLAHASRGELAVQDVQVDVGQQRGNDPALRSPGDRPLKAPVHHHPCLQPQADQLQHPPVRHPAPHLGEQPLMADLAEEVPDVELHDKVAARDEPGSQPLHRLHSRPLRPEPERARQEIRLEHRLQHYLRRLLGHPVADRRDTERPLAAIWLRDVHAPGGRGTVRALAQVSAEAQPGAGRTPYSSCTYARVTRSTPAAPRFFRTRCHASHRTSPL